MGYNSRIYNIASIVYLPFLTSMKNQVALIIIFNHKYNKNIEVLRHIYKNRFTNIYFLVPFYEGNHPDVIAVYGSSYYFQGYLAQGFRQYFKEAYKHYFFVADDMILNPAIHEDNYTDFFQLQQNESFIPEIFSLHNFSNDDTLLLLNIMTAKKGKVKKFWWRTRLAYLYNPEKKGVEIEKELPSYTEAAARLEQHGYEIKPLSYYDIFGGINADTSIRYKLKHGYKLLLNAGKLTKKFYLKYPLVASYSDIVIVSKNSIEQFVHYCGVFAATKLFVEVAIPTALLLAADKVKTEPGIGKRGLLYWNYSPEQIARYENDMQQYNYELQQLLQRFPSDKLYIHPIKLSKWKTTLPKESLL